MGDAICLPMKAGGVKAPDGTLKSLWFFINSPSGETIFHLKVDPKLFPWIKLNETVSITLGVLQVTAEGENAPPPIIGLR